MLQYQRVPDREGFLAADLAQQPAWVRALAWLLVATLFAALAFGAWRGTTFLRRRGAPDPLLQDVDAFEPDGAGEDEG